jgi:hypothetical protein
VPLIIKYNYTIKKGAKHGEKKGGSRLRPASALAGFNKASFSRGDLCIFELIELSESSILIGGPNLKAEKEKRYQRYQRYLIHRVGPDKGGYWEVIEK